jgi:hypothetical protein
MLCAHASQMFEWLPYNSGRLDEVPPDPAGRLAMMLQRVERGGRARAELARRTGVRVGPVATCTLAELFQISEYGRQPDDENLRALFGG